MLKTISIFIIVFIYELIYDSYHADNEAEELRFERISVKGQKMLLTWLFRYYCKYGRDEFRILLESRMLFGSTERRLLKLI